MTFKQTLHSMIFLALGGLVLLASLFVAHKHQLLTVEATQPTQSSESSSDVALWQWWFDRRLPGSMPYVLLRGREKMADLRRDDRQDPEVTLARAHDRLLSADYAFSLGRQQEAISTIHKSFGYLHLSWQHCVDNPECTQETRVALLAVHTQMDAVLQRWIETEPNDSVKVAVSQLQERILHFEQRLQQLASMSPKPSVF